ncbi:MAG: hypothetical protein CVU09_16755 [Bacteroidetes bacterium HGW-Bacteroidetes-4]|jgi:hypothetical protein|nr:MAG: hypothetical protein CVU09_16755 [Bacteroidetes bacterium HGW-Bacteroidetes-4]
MQKLLLLSVCLIILTGVAVAQEQETQEKVQLISNTEADDSLEYEVIIFDAGYEAWLHSHTKPISYYSQSYLENWNRQYVLEWNYRYQSGLNPDIVGSYIDYQPNIDYGKEVNYQLYTYFVYVEEKLNLKLLNRGTR